MPKMLVTLLAACSATLALAAEGPRKVWTAADVIAVSGGTPEEVRAAETAAPVPAAAAPAKAATKAKTRKAASKKPKAKVRKAATKRARGKTTR